MPGPDDREKFCPGEGYLASFAEDYLKSQALGHPAVKACIEELKKEIEGLKAAGKLLVERIAELEKVEPLAEAPEVDWDQYGTPG